MVCTFIFFIAGCESSNSLPKKENISSENNFTETSTQSEEVQQNLAFDAQRKADINSLVIALEIYYADYNLFPENLDLLSDYISLGSIPVDPFTHQSYVYTVGATYLNYTLSASLSDGNLYTKNKDAN